MVHLTGIQLFVTVCALTNCYKLTNNIKLMLERVCTMWGNFDIYFHSCKVNKKTKSAFLHRCAATHWCAENFQSSCIMIL